MASEPCYCGAIDCPICGPLQGYRVTPKWAWRGLSAEDLDILREDATDHEMEED